MFSRLFTRSDSQPAPPSARVPDSSRIYAIGDIHGRLDLLERLRTMIEEDANRRPIARKVVVYLGDYSAGGSASGDVVDLLMRKPLSGFESVFIKGNHEDSLLR